VIWFVAWHMLAAFGAWGLANVAVVVLYRAVRRRRAARRLVWSARDDREWREYAAQGRQIR
jgi:hypothetical protein